MVLPWKGKKKKERKAGYPHKRHIWTNTRQKPTRFINRTLPSHSAQALNPVAVVTFPLYTMAEGLHNVFLPVQFVAHTTAEWAGSTPNYPPTLHPMLMKSWPDWGVFVRQMEALEPCYKWSPLIRPTFPDSWKSGVKSVGA